MPRSKRSRTSGVVSRALVRRVAQTWEDVMCKGVASVPSSYQRLHIFWGDFGDSSFASHGVIVGSPGSLKVWSKITEMGKDAIAAWVKDDWYTPVDPVWATGDGLEWKPEWLDYFRRSTTEMVRFKMRQLRSVLHGKDGPALPYALYTLRLAIAGVHAASVTLSVLNATLPVPDPPADLSFAALYCLEFHTSDSTFTPEILDAAVVVREQCVWTLEIVAEPAPARQEWPAMWKAAALEKAHSIAMP